MEQNLLLLRRLDELYTEYPFYGSRRMLAVLRPPPLAASGHLISIF
jgi:hypothetical protein